MKTISDVVNQVTDGTMGFEELIYNVKAIALREALEKLANDPAFDKQETELDELRKKFYGKANDRLGYKKYDLNNLFSTH